MRELAVAAWPHEACGLLVRTGPGGAGATVRAIACRNEAAEPAQGYLIDPEAFLRAEHAARVRGGAVVGVWHSHPHGDPTPSLRDRRESWPGWSYLIMGVTRTQVTAPRAWRIADERCREQRVEIRRLA